MIYLFCLAISGYMALFAADTKIPADDIKKAAVLFDIWGPSLPDQSEITKTFRAKAKRCHPDKCPGDPARADQEFKQLGRAYEILQRYAGYVPGLFTREHTQTSSSAGSSTESRTSSGSQRKPKASTDPAKITEFSPEFVLNVILWTREEKSQSSIARKWATQHITPAMRLCDEWLLLMGLARTNCWQELEKCVKANPQLVQLHDGQADALSLALSAYDGAPDFMHPGMIKIQNILKEHGAIARFPDYKDGFIGWGRHGYWY